MVNASKKEFSRTNFGSLGIGEAVKAPVVFKTLHPTAVAQKHNFIMAVDLGQYKSFVLSDNNRNVRILRTIKMSGVTVVSLVLLNPFRQGLPTAGAASAAARRRANSARCSAGTGVGPGYGGSAADGRGGIAPGADGASEELSWSAFFPFEQVQGLHCVILHSGAGNHSGLQRRKQSQAKNLVNPIHPPERVAR
jgi:hypothetical protein